MTGPERTETMFDRLHPSGAWGKLATLDTAGSGSATPSPAPARGHRLDDIVSRGTLRVCVSPDAMPWCYVNGHGDIVGFDVDIAHAIGKMKAVDPQGELVRTARAIGISFGD